jgi:hypothetical protein
MLMLVKLLTGYVVVVVVVFGMDIDTKTSFDWTHSSTTRPGCFLY